jgi:hypothetical protein
MAQDYFIYLVTYSFCDAHSAIRERFRDWLKNEMNATFCDESTYGIKKNMNVGEMRKIVTTKLKELYGHENAADGDFVNLFCSALHADFNAINDNSTRKQSFDICQYKIIDNGHFI